ncbi:MAG TPA: sulfite exporter TauE/SafE family protein [Peptostreptococcaceae bacterium]|nr:sulfite exporter TauE/SafE family protein [Peptostreptococcaceae bacterium]
MSIKTQSFYVADMVCNSCEKIIEEDVKNLSGVQNVKASFKASTVVAIYDSSECSYEDIKKTIKKCGYNITTQPSSNENTSQFIKNAILIIGLVFIMTKLTSISNYFDISSILNSNTTYFVIFIVGLLSSLHCVGMCGGIMLSQSLSQNDVGAPLLYNLGRVISYTILGGVIGALGSALSINTHTSIIIYILAGFFMIVHGANTMGFKVFRGLSFKLPFTSNCPSKSTNSTPFVVGLLNGFMPCGPLQTMQLFALSTGSMTQGALSMFIFSVGTVPLMLLFGYMANSLSKNTSKKLIKFSGALIIVLGLVTANRGLSLSGVDINPLNTYDNYVSSNNNVEDLSKNYGVETIEDGVQTVKITADYSGYTPSLVYIKKDIPTRFIIDGKQLSGCNNAIVIPSLNVEKKLQEGENVIEFTPNNVTSIDYSCWMGMISGSIEVVDDISDIQ